MNIAYEQKNGKILIRIPFILDKKYEKLFSNIPTELWLFDYWKVPMRSNRKHFFFLGCYSQRFIRLLAMLSALFHCHLFFSHSTHFIVSFAILYHVNNAATTFLELWKRKQALIIWEWDLQNIEDDEENRPEFEASAKNFRVNPVTKEREPYIPTLTKAFRYFVAASVVTIMVCWYVW